MAKELSDKLGYNPLRQDDFFDDFHGLDTSIWTDTSADAGASVALAATGVSAVTAVTGATDNNECLFTSKRAWDITRPQPLVVEARFQFPAVGSNKSSFFLGLSSTAAGADALADAGTGIGADFSGFGIQKLEDANVWQFVSSVGTTQTKTTLTNVAGQTGYQTVRFEVRPISATQADVIVLHDRAGIIDIPETGQNAVAVVGTMLEQPVDSNFQPIKHRITYTSFAPAFFAMAQKTQAAAELTVHLDYVRVSQLK